MSALLDKPPCLHREVKPVRECLDCGAYLSSANRDEKCAQCGGWSIQRYKSYESLQVREDRADLICELMEMAA